MVDMSCTPNYPDTYRHPANSHWGLLPLHPESSKLLGKKPQPWTWPNEAGGTAGGGGDNTDHEKADAAV